MKSVAGAFALLLCAFAVSPTLSGENQRIARLGDWSVFRDGEGADLLCWVATRGRLGVVDLGTAAGAGPGDEVLILFSAGLDEFSVELRGASEPLGESTLALGGTRFPLFFQDGAGWSEDRSLDADLKTALAGPGIGTLDLGGASYRFSLKGFAPALAAAEEACQL